MRAYYLLFCIVFLTFNSCKSECNCETDCPKAETEAEVLVLTEKNLINEDLLYYINLKKQQNSYKSFKNFYKDFKTQNPSDTTYKNNFNWVLNREHLISSKLKSPIIKKFDSTVVNCIPCPDSIGNGITFMENFTTSSYPIKFKIKCCPKFSNPAYVSFNSELKKLNITITDSNNKEILIDSSDFLNTINSNNLTLPLTLKRDKGFITHKMKVHYEDATRGNVEYEVVFKE